MAGIRSYFTAVVAICMIAVLVNVLVKQGSIQNVVRLVIGLLLVLVVLKPLGAIDLEALSLDLTGESLDLREPEQAYQEALRAHIKESTECYIEEYAKELGAYVQAEVTLSEDEYPVPAAVKIVGSLNEEQLEALYAYVTDSLGIAQENQEWKIYGTIG